MCCERENCYCFEEREKKPDFCSSCGNEAKDWLLHQKTGLCRKCAAPRIKHPARNYEDIQIRQTLLLHDWTVPELRREAKKLFGDWRLSEKQFNELSEKLRVRAMNALYL
jgi:hypothetical protein